MSGSSAPTPDVIVVGGGHAGIEASLAAARIGCSVLMVTPSRRRIGEMSCNPAIGGIAKGTLVREIDALGGSMARIADETALQFRMLNTGKGPAVWGPRVQSDAARYAVLQRGELTRHGVGVLEDEVLSLEGPCEEIRGVLCRGAGAIRCRAVVLATGTFLAGRLFVGSETWRGGRLGDMASDSLERDLRRRMFHVERFKTGTPPRIVRRSVDPSELEPQESTGESFRFAFGDVRPRGASESFHRTETNARTREAALDGLSESPLLTGRITGRGPRYCPSFEDKVTKFPDRTRHVVYVEPMGAGSRLLYLNGLSTSLPRGIQERMVRSLPGFGRAVICEYGYAVEYTCLHPAELTGSLRLARTTNVFAAGQICGTSGYEEAAALGLLAGANAALTLAGRERLHPDRMDGFLGVMVQDIVSGSASGEPYRLFSSRAENRLHIRQDNAERRMLPLAEAAGLLDPERLAGAERRRGQAEAVLGILRGRLPDGVPASVHCRRPGVATDTLVRALPGLAAVDPEVLRSVVLDERYGGYVQRATRRMEARRRAGSLDLSGIGSYMDVKEICWEAREALERHRPATLAEAGRVPGVRPSDLEGLLVFMASRRSTWNTPDPGGEPPA